MDCMLGFCCCLNAPDRWNLSGKLLTLLVRPVVPYLSLLSPNLVPPMRPPLPPSIPPLPPPLPIPGKPPRPRPPLQAAKKHKMSNKKHCGCVMLSQRLLVCTVSAEHCMMPQLYRMPQLEYGNTSGGRPSGSNACSGQASYQFQQKRRKLLQCRAQQGGAAPTLDSAQMQL